MVGQIGPLVKVGKPYRISASHMAGAVVGGLTLGTLLGAAGTMLQAIARPPQTLAAIVVVLILLGSAANDAALIQLPRLGPARQTPQSWICSYGRTGGVFAWGFDLGLVFTTRLTSWGVFALVAYTILHGSIVSGGFIFGTYATVRALAAVVVAERSDYDVGGTCTRLSESQQARLRVAAIASAAAAGSILWILL